MDTKSLSAAASSLGNQLAAGIPIRDAVARMARLQPTYAEQWQEAATAIAAGKTLSSKLAGWWPDSLVSAVVAGESAGKLPEVFALMEKALEIQMEVGDILRKLLYPLGIAAGGGGAFVFFMTYVLPNVSKTLGASAGVEQNVVLRLSKAMAEFIDGREMLLFGVIIGIGMSFYAWFRNPINREKVISAMLSLPFLQNSMTKVYFGLWAYYLALMDAAGLAIREKLLLSSKILPDRLRTGAILMSDEVITKGMADACDPTVLPEDDPRQHWPFYMVVAFSMAQETGQLDQQMQRVAPIMVKEGRASVESAIAVMNYVAISFAGVLVMTPLAAYYYQMGIMLQKAFHS